MNDKINVSNTATNGGVGFLGLLTIVFVIAKLLGIINWSWWLVFLPIWGGTALVLGILLLGLIGYLVVFVVKGAVEHRRRKRAYERIKKYIN